VTIKDDASPSPSPSVTRTATASPTATPTATAGAAAGGSGGGLAITGVSVPLVAGVGIAFLVAGLFALRLGRRRTDG
jgi:hypothetical protein